MMLDGNAFSAMILPLFAALLGVVVVTVGLLPAASLLWQDTAIW